MPLSQMTRKQYRERHPNEGKPEKIELSPVPPVRVTVSIHVGEQADVLSHTLSDIERMDVEESIMVAAAQMGVRAFQSLEIDRLTTTAEADLPTQATMTAGTGYPMSDEDGHRVGVTPKPYSAQDN